MLKTRKRLHNLLLSALLTVVTSSPAMGSEFLLFYANDVHGETEPCG